MAFLLSLTFCGNSNDECLGAWCNKSQKLNDSTRTNDNMESINSTNASSKPRIMTSTPTEPTDHTPNKLAIELNDPEPVIKEQSSYLEAPAPEAPRQRSTHHDEELGLIEYVSEHTQRKRKPFLQKGGGDSASKSPPNYSGHEKEVIISFGAEPVDDDDLVLVASGASSAESSRDIWQSKLSNDPSFDTQTPLCSSNMIRMDLMKYDQFIVADDESGLYAFDELHNEWNLCMKYTMNIQLVDHSICYDPFRDIIYICGEMNDSGAMIYVDRNTTEIVNDELELFGSFPVMLMVNETLHLVTGAFEDSDSEDSEDENSAHSNVSDTECQRHLIWNYDTNEFESIFIFPPEVQGRCTLYIKSKNVLLLLERNGIWKCVIEDKEWKKLNDIKLPKEMKTDGCALSRCENYLIVYGCGEDHGQMFIFDVRDLDNITYFKSTVNSPEIAANYKCMTEDNVADEVLISGYVGEMRRNVSHKVIRIIEMFYIEQHIHIISSINSHFTAIVHSILNEEDCNDYLEDNP